MSITNNILSAIVGTTVGRIREGKFGDTQTVHLRQNRAFNMNLRAYKCNHCTLLRC